MPLLTKCRSVAKNFSTRTSKSAWFSLIAGKASLDQENAIHIVWLENLGREASVDDVALPSAVRKSINRQAGSAFIVRFFVTSATTTVLTVPA